MTKPSFVVVVVVVVPPIFYPRVARDDLNNAQVGAATETELKDKKLRYEDALNSVRSAIEMGVVPGGGACLQYIQRMGKWGACCVPQLILSGVWSAIELEMFVL